jgi:UDP-N-acetylmuramoyl-L-alanyl-D-glutamate--2,6-diaminopimelate ligase
MASIKSLIPQKFKILYHILQSQIASIRHNNPSKDLKIIGVTGTSGKTTTSSLIYHILENAGYQVGLISTVEARVGDQKLDTGLHVTTPDPAQLQEIFAFMDKNEAEYVVLEVSSHSLAQGRIGMTKFDGAVFTNIKRDHLDWHKTWQHYANSKAILIKKSKPNSPIIFGKDDKKVFRFLKKKINQADKNLKAITFSKNEAKDAKSSLDGLSFTYKDTNFKVPIFGDYNIFNILPAAKITQQFGVSLKQIQKALQNYSAPQGRMQVMQKEPFFVIVDFAHNEDSFRKALKSARKLVKGEGQVITVFGSAGLRDKEKRTTMGQASGELADITIATAEDPRIESLEKINSKIIKGAQSKGAKFIKRFNNHEEYIKFIQSKPQVQKKSIFAFDEESVKSRFDAIDMAIQTARKGDVIITQGKGHEQSLCFGSQEYPFTDQNAVKKALERRKEDK